MNSAGGAKQLTDPFIATREQFHLPDGLVYLDGNSLGVLPKATADRVTQTVEKEWGRMPLAVGIAQAGWRNQGRWEIVSAR